MRGVPELPTLTMCRFFLYRSGQNAQSPCGRGYAIDASVKGEMWCFAEDLARDK